MTSELNTVIVKVIQDVINSDVVPTEDTDIRTLGDSLDAVEVIMKIEDRFDIFIRDSEADHLLTINDLIKLVGSKVNDK